MNLNLSLRRGLFLIVLIVVLAGTALTVLKAVAGGKSEAPGLAQNPGLFYVDYRHLDGGQDGVALLDLNPESGDFGRLLQRKFIGEGVLPHHLYFNRAQDRLYTTSLSGSMLYEVITDSGADGVPRITRFEPIDTGGNIVGEDMYFTEDGSRYYVTFMGGRGGDEGGTVGVFDAHTNELLEEIIAPVPADPASDEPFILYPHGISANEELGILMVTSTAHPDGVSGAGNTVTAIDMATNEPIQTYLVADAPDDLSAPVEVILLRDDLPPYALATTLNGAGIWVAAYDEAAGAFGEFAKEVDGEASGLGVALEFYIYTDHHGETELYVSFAVPGVVNVYSLDNLPELTLKRTLTAEPGAHHMAFFTTESGRELLVVQNNLLNIDGINTGTLTILDVHTGDVVETVDMPAEYKLLPESIESVFGHGHDYHH
jgi:DNA-binding beta-propeller fold protein YncE